MMIMYSRKNIFDLEITKYSNSIVKEEEKWEKTKK